MTPDKVKQAFEACAKALPPCHALRAKGDADGTHYTHAVQHARWMCSEGVLLVEQGRVEKAMRWLGFVQGVLWAHGLAEISELKDMNKPDGACSE